MWIVAIAWIYVALMMALAEATSSQGSVLGAVITFVMYGVAPLALVLYLLGTPARRRAIKAKEEAEWRAQLAADQSTAGSTQADAGSLAASHGVTPERKEL